MRRRSKRKRGNRRKRKKGILDISLFTQSGEVVLPNVFSQNNFRFNNESASPAQPQPELPQP
jgi:hypothetical protein